MASFVRNVVRQEDHNEVANSVSESSIEVVLMLSLLN
jgi:hypothetical protein